MNLELIWQIIVAELTKNHVQKMDQKNLAVFCKTISEVNITFPSFWKAAQERLKEIEHDFDLRNCSFLLYAMANAGILSEIQYLKLTQRSILNNFDEINWKDLPMILSVAEKLDFTQLLESKEYLLFLDTIGESISSLIKTSSQQSNLKHISFKSYMIVAFTVGNYFQPLSKGDNEEIWLLLD